MIVIFDKNSAKIHSVGSYKPEELDKILEDGRTYEEYSGDDVPLPVDEYIRVGPGQYRRLPDHSLAEKEVRKQEDKEAAQTLPAKKLIRRAWLDIPEKKRDEAVKALDALPEILKETVLYFVGKINED